MPNIFFLAKFFEKPEYAVDFVQGRIYANTLKFFQELECSNPSDRADRYEGIMAWLQPEGTIMEIGGAVITADDLAGPVEIRTNWANYLNVFSMHAGHSEALDVPSPAGLTAEDIRRELLVPEACASFGEDAVLVTNASEFIARVKTALPAGFKLYRDLVQYYDPDAYSGHFYGVEPAFRKQLRHSYEREYRLAFESPSERKKPLDFKVGDLSDITVRVKFSDLNSSLRVTSRDDLNLP